MAAGVVFSLDYAHVDLFAHGVEDVGPVVADGARVRETPVANLPHGLVDAQAAVAEYAHAVW